MNANFIKQMRALRNLGTPWAEGIPSIRSLIIRSRSLDLQTQMIASTFLSISPLPHITTLTPKIAGAYKSAGIDVEIDDYQVKGIGRYYLFDDGEMGGYERSQLVGTSIAYFVDGVLSADGNRVISGQECDFIGITERALQWDLVLRRKPDDR